MVRVVHDRRGFTLLEVLIALIVFAVGLLGIAGMMIASIRGNTFASRLSAATNLAQDKIEELRNVPYINIYKDCQNSASWANTADPTTCNDPPANIDDDGTLIAALDDGGNACNSNAPCGDITANDYVYTYSNQTTIGGIQFNRIWTVQRNFPAYKMIKVETVVSWLEKNTPHQVNVTTVLTQ